MKTSLQILFSLGLLLSSASAFAVPQPLESSEAQQLQKVLAEAGIPDIGKNDTQSIYNSGPVTCSLSPGMGGGSAPRCRIQETNKLLSPEAAAFVLGLFEKFAVPAQPHPGAVLMTARFNCIYFYEVHTEYQCWIKAEHISDR